MPTYTYHCDACDKDFETEQRISEPALKKCLLCGKQKAHRTISSGNFILKGGGWYSDGYGSSSKGSSSGKSEPAAAPSTPAPSSSSDD